MALWSRIMVNSESIGGFTIERISGQTNGPCTYNYDVMHNGRLFQGTVIHEYDDGALVLIAKIFEDVTQIESARRVGLT